MSNPEFDGRVYFRLLAAVAAADGQIDDREIIKFKQLVKLGGGDPNIAGPMCAQAMAAKGDPLWFLEDVKVGRAFAKRCVRDAILMCASDGHMSKSERELIRWAGQRLDVDDVVKKIPGFGTVELTRAELDEITEELPIAPEKGDGSLDVALSTTYRRGMPDFDGRIYFRVIASAAAADGEIRTEEIRKITELLRMDNGDIDLVGPLCSEALHHRTEGDPWWMFDGHVMPEEDFAKLCLRDAAMVIASDGGIHANEELELQELANLLGLKHLLDDIGVNQFVAASTHVDEERIGRAQVDRVLGGVMGAAVLGGGAYVLIGGGAAMVAGLVAAMGMGMGGWVAPALLLTGAGVASLGLQVARMFDKEHDEE